MKVILSKVTSKGQAPLPADVRRLLRIGPGDRVAFKVEGNCVQIERATSVDIEFAAALESTLATEWLAQEDEDAYGDLGTIRRGSRPFSIH